MNQSPRTSWLAVMAATLVGFGLLFAPRSQTNRIETVVNDASLPGLTLLSQSQTWVMALPERIEEYRNSTEGVPKQDDELPAVTADRIAALEAEVRQLQSQNAQLYDELEQAKTATGSPFLAEPGTPLFVPELIDANVVAADDVSIAIQRASAQRVVDVGQTDGVVPADFVVSAGSPSSKEPRLLIDQGDDVGLHADQAVFAGRCVIGKVQQVGRWTSSILPVTDAEYRGRAQLMRRTSQGLIVGPEGLIAGDGASGCRLDFIAATESVSVGDEIYTAISGTPLPSPMYYGRVIAATLPTGAPYWEITVKPAETMAKTRSVQVLRAILNPARTQLFRPQTESP